LKLTFLIFLFISAKIIPQTIDTIFVDTHKFISTGTGIISSPLSFNATDLIKLGGVAAAVSGAFLLDHEVKTMAGKNINDFNNRLFDIDRYYYVPAAAVISGGVYFYGFFSEDKEIRQLGLDLGEAAFYANTINVILKLATSRSRPLRTDDNTEFRPFKLAPINSAFASGHTTLAFAISTVMAEYSDNVIWKVAWYTAAGLTGAARIYRKMHWFSDVVLGAAIGYYIGSYVTGGTDKTEFYLIPGGAGMSVNF
jgi:membrane-associated phospholipid phosphatase